MTQPPIETLTEFNVTADLRRIIDTAYVPNDRPTSAPTMPPTSPFAGAPTSTATRRSPFGREIRRADCPAP